MSGTDSDGTSLKRKYGPNQIPIRFCECNSNKLSRNSCINIGHYDVLKKRDADKFFLLVAGDSEKCGTSLNYEELKKLAIENPDKFDEIMVNLKYVSWSEVDDSLCD